jgi:hypothetical protein
MVRRAVPVLVLVPLLSAHGGATPSPHGPSAGPPTAHSYALQSDPGVGKYEMLYGPPEFRALDDDGARPWPDRKAIRTTGRLEEIRGRGRSGEASPGRGESGGEWDNPYALYRLCRERTCLALVPVPEIRNAFDGAAAFSVQQEVEVEVIGAIDEVPVPGQPAQTRPRGFLVWSFFESPGRAAGTGAREGSSLEPLVRYPAGAKGRVVTASGVFRGANLFEDLPPESRRRPDDWVLRDGPFSIWVTGKAPRGKGWSLDPRSRSDCAWRMTVEGKVEAAGGYVYLRATRLSLVARVKEERGP